MHLAPSMIVKLALCSMSGEPVVAVSPQPVTMAGVPGEYVTLLFAGRHIGLVDLENSTGSANSIMAKFEKKNYHMVKFLNEKIPTSRQFYEFFHVEKMQRIRQIAGRRNYIPFKV